MTTTGSTLLAEPSVDAADLRSALAAIVGADHVSDDRARRVLHSQDIWSMSEATVALVVAPGSLDEVARVVAAVSAAGFAVSPRGAGMSYTGAYLPATDRSVSLDMGRMNRIVRISAEDMTVTVEAGCTWAALNDALQPLGLRTPFWGPVSGLVTTIGGGISQQNAFYGGARYGNSSESVVALSVVLADGSVLKTGARGADGGTPFYRYYGPDLTGLFCGDCGVFGVKAEITLRLIRLPAQEDGVSFAFRNGEDLVHALAEMARADIACETCGFDPGLTKIRMARASLAGDVKTLGAVVAKEKSALKGLVAAGKIALAGRSFLGAEDYSLHVLCEGRAKAAVAADIAEARRIAKAHHGREIENTIAKVIRAVPFAPLNTILGPAGERWVPTHGHVPLSQAAAIFSEIRALLDGLADRFEAAGVSTGMLFTTLSTNALDIEPIFYWPDEHFAIHETAVEPAILAKLPVLPPTPAVTELIADTRKHIIAIFAAHGCAHFQIGRTYPYKASRDHASWRLVEAVKEALDPGHALNPGILGL